MTLPAAADRCSYRARALDEPLAATASRVRRWLLVEQPGPWGADAVMESRLDPVVAVDLLRAARAAYTRLVLIRQGVGATPSPPRRRWYAVRSHHEAPGLLGGSFSAEQELLAIEVEAVVAAAPVGGGPVFLVCTNGKHDPCCAEWGRPVYRALALSHPGEAVFECSHIGGDRFAANVVCLPQGIYYGQVDPSEAGEIVDRYHEGRLLLDRYRGRSCYTVPEQAAEIAVRRELGIDTFAGVRPIASGRSGEHDWDVTLAVEGNPPRDVTVVVGHAQLGRPMTCGGDAGQPRTVVVRKRR